MPEERIPPGSQAVICAEIVNIIDIKILMRGGIGVKALVQAAEIVGTAMRVPDIAVAHQAVVGAVKVILDDGAVEFGFQRLPHPAQSGVYSAFSMASISACGVAVVGKLMMLRQLVWI